MQPILYQPHYQQQYELYLYRLVFLRAPEEDFVTLFGAWRHPVSGQLQDRDFGCDFAQLTDLLLLAGRSGDALIQQVAQLLGDGSTDREAPVVLDVIELLGRPLIIRNIELTIYKPMEPNSAGSWETVKEEYFLIDTFHQLSHQERHYLKLQQRYSGLIGKLDQAYAQYRRLRKTSYSNKAARKKSKLTDDQLFRLAKARYHLLRTDKSVD